MINILASAFHTEPALIWVALVIIFVFVLFALASAKRKGPNYIYSGHSLADAENIRLANFEFIKKMGEMGKKLYEAIAKAIIEGKGGGGLYVIIALIVVFVVSVGYASLDYAGMIEKQPVTVGPRDSCYRPNIVGAWDLLKEGEIILPGDSCNGKIVVATQVPTQIPTQAPTQTPLPAMVFTPGTVEILPSATPVVAEEDNYPILTVKSGGITGVIGGWTNISTSALSASQAVESKTCDLVGFGEKTKPQFIVPSWAQSAYLVFYEPNSLWEVTNTQLSISGDTITITLCKEDVMFELFAY